MSEPRELFRAVLGDGRTPDGDRSSLIVARREGEQVWLTLDGGWRTTFVMNDAQAARLVSLVDQARTPR